MVKRLQTDIPIDTIPYGSPSMRLRFVEHDGELYAE